MEAAQAAAAAGRPHGGAVERRRAGRAGRVVGRAPHPAARHPDAPRRVGAVSIPPLLVLERVGLFPGAAQYVADAVDQLRRRRDKLIVDGNAAQQLADGDRPHHADRLRRRRHRRGGGVPLQVPGQRERQGPGVLRRRPGDVPQRDLRLGPARRHHPAGHDRRPVPARLRAPAGGPPLRPHPRGHRRGGPRRHRRDRPRARARWPSCSTSSSRATSSASTWPSRPGSTRARSRCSSTSRPP